MGRTALNMRAHLLRTLARASARNGTATARAAAAAPQSWRRLATSPLATDAVNLDLSQAKALTCHNMMCEHVGEPCGCRIAAFLERRSFPKLETLSLRGAGLRAVPDAVLRLPLLRELDLSRNELLRALPDDLAALESLETLDVTETALEALPPRLFVLPRLRRVAADAELLVAPAGWTAAEGALERGGRDGVDVDVGRPHAWRAGVVVPERLSKVKCSTVQRSARLCGTVNASPSLRNF